MVRPKYVLEPDVSPITISVITRDKASSTLHSKKDVSHIRCSYRSAEASDHRDTESSD